MRLLKVPFSVKVSKAQEISRITTNVADLVKENALIKALDVAEEVREGIVIGADTVVYAKGHLVLKPKNHAEAKKKLKIFRLEAVRAGFKKAWQERDYPVIVAVADKIPNNVLEEDPKLLIWYDQAVTRMGGE